MRARNAETSIRRRPRRAAPARRIEPQPPTRRPRVQSGEGVLAPAGSRRAAPAACDTDLSGRSERLLVRPFDQSLGAYVDQPDAVAGHREVVRDVGAALPAGPERDLQRPLNGVDHVAGEVQGKQHPALRQALRAVMTAGAGCRPGPCPLAPRHATPAVRLQPRLPGGRGRRWTAVTGSESPSVPGAFSRTTRGSPSSSGPGPPVAQALNTTTAHAVHLLSRNPVDCSPPRFRRTQHTATRIGQWRTWYEQDRLSLQDIADREGTSLATVRLALLKNDVPLRPAGSHPGRPRRR